MEEKNEKVVSVNIENYTGEKPIEVIVRKGEAPQAVNPLPLLEPLSCDLAGTIEAPANWLEKRAGEFNGKSMYAIVDREKLKICLVVNETDKRNKRTIIGKAELSDVFLGFRINDNEGWDPSKLGQFVRLHRSFFEDKKVAAELVAKLKKFSASVKSKLDKAQDRNGSMQVAYEQEVSSNLPTDFKVSLPIFKGNFADTHHHPHEQCGYVISGEYRLKVELPDRPIDVILRAGDSYAIPGGTPHSFEVLEGGEVVDVFTPQREDYL